MIAFVKYCGGCNEHYSRVAAVREIQAAVSGSCLAFEQHDPLHIYDIGLVVMGCARACIKTDSLAPCNLIVYVRAKEEIPGAIVAIQNYINQHMENE